MPNFPLSLLTLTFQSLPDSACPVLPRVSVNLPDLAPSLHVDMVTSIHHPVLNMSSQGCTFLPEDQPKAQSVCLPDVTQWLC